MSIMASSSIVLPFLNLVLLIILSKIVWGIKGEDRLGGCLSSNVLKCWSRHSSKY